MSVLFGGRVFMPHKKEKNGYRCTEPNNFGLVVDKFSPVSGFSDCLSQRNRQNRNYQKSNK